MSHRALDGSMEDGLAATLVKPSRPSRSASAPDCAPRTAPVESNQSMFMPDTGAPPSSAGTRPGPRSMRLSLDQTDPQGIPSGAVNTLVKLSTAASEKGVAASEACAVHVARSA